MNLPREKKIEGKYILVAGEVNLDGVGAVDAYKELADVEKGFRNLKDIIELRPIYHHKTERVKGHIFIATLSFLLQRALQRFLREGGVDLRVREAMQALETVRVVEFEVADRPHKVVTRPSSHAAAILKALGIKVRKPPRPGCDPAAM